MVNRVLKQRHRGMEVSYPYEFIETGVLLSVVQGKEHAHRERERERNKNRFNRR